ncbi:TetR/AcrR family transcriptional regulator [Sulfobacillus sp. DSM 109850]|uniref:TetR/AcrR family transcriptional regulator n=1 Tax=Sulfobacillus harzensis TaxID=2729629 RepID=A0A7Y0Q4N1_9FIRM|nr:TetR/AcrR family transcriptional regulator [Sulfobacillus harzensis]
MNVTELTQSVGVTTGVLYHHFGSKEGLYAVVREELERRVVDRMDGAAAVLSDEPDRAVAGTALVGFDAAIQLNAHRVLAEPPRRRDHELIADYFRRLCQGRPPGLEVVLAAAWRAALQMVVDGHDPVQARSALEWIVSRKPASPP